MNTKRVLVLIAVFVLVTATAWSCGNNTPSATVSTITPSPAAANVTVVAVNTVAPLTSETPVILSPTPGAPTQSGATQAVVVVTATGMQDIGSLLGNQPMTPVAGDLIDWDHLAKMDEWEQFPGIAEGVNVLYVQSGVPNKIDLPSLPGTTDSHVPSGSVLIIGGYTVSFKIGDKSYSITNGFLGAFTEGTKISNVVIKDGFAALVLRDDAQIEYCARVAQAMNEKWAPFDGKQEVKDHLYRPAAWTDPVCTGVITTPLDSDR